MAVRIDGAVRELLFLLEPKNGLGSPLDALHGMRFKRAAIDMPIGLPVRGYRDCDREARKLLGRNASRAFLGARRCVLTAKSQNELNAKLKSAGEPGVSAELFCLKKKLKEVDAFVRAHRERDVREAHPELVFQHLNGGKPVPRKRDAAGLKLRRKLLEDDGFRDLDEWLTWKRLGTGAKPDDILDACAMAIAARDFSDKRVLPRGHVPKDKTGLPMQIWY